MSSSISTQRVDANGVVACRFGARTIKIWPIEAVGALGTTAAAKALRGLGGLSKQKCALEVP